MVTATRLNNNMVSWKAAGLLKKVIKKMRRVDRDRCIRFADHGKAVVNITISVMGNCSNY